MKYFIEKYKQHEAFTKPTNENLHDFMGQINDDELTQDKIYFIEILVITKHPIVDRLNQEGWGIEKWIVRMKNALPYGDH